MKPRIKLAIVDDHPFMRRGIISMLGKHPEFEIVSSVGSGKEFIDSLKEGQKPDLVLLNLEMPEMDGLEVADYLEQKQPDIKMLILSECIENPDWNELIERGADGFIGRFDGFKIVIKAIRTIMNGEYYF